MNPKPFLILFLLAVFLLYRLLPRTRFGRRLRMSETAFCVINIVGAVCGAIGVAVYKEGILEGLIWFPIYVFFTLAVYSGSTLYFFRRS